MYLYLLKDNNNALHEVDGEHCQKLPRFEPLLFEYKKVRNPLFHRKYFAMIRLAFNNQNEFTNETLFRKYMQMKAGYYDVINGDKGAIPIPKSIKYEALDQIEFEALYEKVWIVLSKRYNFNHKFMDELNKLC